MRRKKKKTEEKIWLLFVMFRKYVKVKMKERERERRLKSVITRKKELEECLPFISR
jgi:hypothetical protein